MDIKFNKTEKYFFLLATLLNLVPVLVGQFFPTMDGAAHLYNSNLINALIFNANSNLHDFFIFNHEPVPNWSGHIILTFFNLFLPAFIAEKILLLFYLIGLPYAFRGLIKEIHPEGILVSYFIFPFTFSFLFILGFYNFSLAILFMIITLRFYMRNEEQMFSIKNSFILFIFINLTYFSHIFVFALLLLFLGVQILYKLAINLIQNSVPFRKEFNLALRKTGILFLSALFPLILFINYFYIRQDSGANNFLETSELLSWLKNIRPIIALSIPSEEVFTKKILYLIVFVFALALFDRIRTFIKSGGEPSLKTKFRNIIKVSDFWLIITVIILLLYFVLPDSNSSAGYVSIRLGLIFFIILTIWLACQKYQKWLIIPVVAAVLFLNLKLNIYYSKSMKELNKIAINCNAASSYIPENSIVLPLRYSDLWLAGHYSNYLGIDKPMIILENYECGTGYFPLKWNNDSIPNTLLGNIESNKISCLQWRSNSENKSERIDYVFILGNLDMKSDSCSLIVKTHILENYKLIYHNENCELYEDKNAEYISQ